MKKTTLLNAQLSQAIANLGHTEFLTVCDAGLPIPTYMERVDLALTQGVPRFLDTVNVITHEMFVERAIVAEEIQEKNPDIHAALLAQLAELELAQGNDIVVEYVSHQEFKTLSRESKAIVRTGECTPYANVILVSGVPF